MEKNRILEISDLFWKAMKEADEKRMRRYAHPSCRFVHIGITCGLDEEIHYYRDGIFHPTEIRFHSKDVQLYGDTAVVLTDCDYSLLLDGKETTHHFAVTEVYDSEEHLIQFSFTALVY